MTDKTPSALPQPNRNDDAASAVMVREELARILASHYFSRSRRLPALLRYVVEETLDGRGEQIKERTLGVEVFGRPADYDAASDSIVRVTAAEVRKRIAQYYQETGQQDAVRIVFTAGSYTPQFETSEITESDGKADQQLAVESSTAKAPARRHFWRGFAASTLIAVLIALGALWAWRATHDTPFDFFWGPVIKSGGAVTFCIADQKQYSTIVLYDANNLGRQVTLPDKRLTAVVIDDLGPIIHIAGLLQARGKQYSLRGESATSLADLRNGPTVFFGAFDNAWTLRFTQQLRYRFTNNNQMTVSGIVDSRDPRHIWVVSNQQQMTTNNYTDYAIIARFTDNVTGQPAVVVAGVAGGGTAAASEFLTNRKDLTELMHADKSAGGKANMEIVLSTQIIGGQPGAPKIIASYFW